MLAVSIVRKAILNPSAVASSISMPWRSFSLIRSK